MAKTLLRSGRLDDFLALGENGQAVFDSAVQIREALRIRKLHAVVDCLAIPQPNDEGNRVDWYAPFEGSVLSWITANNEQRIKALCYLDNCLTSIATLIQRCQQAEKTAIQLFGSLLANTLQFPGSQYVYLVDGKPVITFWGFANLNKGARTDVLSCLHIEDEPESVIASIPEPSQPKAAPAMVEEIPLSKSDEPLVYTAQPQIAIPEAVITEAVSAPLPATAKPKSRRWILPVATSLALIATPVAYKLLSTAYKLLSTSAQQPVDTSPVTVVEKSTLPLTKAGVAKLQVPISATEPASATSGEVVKNALVLPANEVKIGSTQFLNGVWSVLINMKDPITGKPPTLLYRIANNRGSARLVQADNVVCNAEVFSGLQQSGTLMIKTRGNARCSNGSRYPMPEISCKQDGNSVTECNGRYEGGTVVPLTINRVSD